MHTHGRHQTTAVAGDPLWNRRFDAETLGAWLATRAVGFDDVTTDHCADGSRSGEPEPRHTDGGADG